MSEFLSVADKLRLEGELRLIERLVNELNARHFELEHRLGILDHE